MAIKIIASVITPKADNKINAEFCPDRSGRPKRINTIPNPTNNLLIAIWYLRTSVILNF